jgi:hypothetical protein
MSENLVYVDLFQAPVNPLARLAGRPQRWRWTASNGGNGRALAVSSENYTNRADAVAAIRQLFGTQSNVYLRASEHGNETLRAATS